MDVKWTKCEDHEAELGGFEDKTLGIACLFGAVMVLEDGKTCI